MPWSSAPFQACICHHNSLQSTRHLACWPSGCEAAWMPGCVCRASRHLDTERWLFDKSSGMKQTQSGMDQTYMQILGEKGLSLRHGKQSEWGKHHQGGKLDWLARPARRLKQRVGERTFLGATYRARGLHGVSRGLSHLPGLAVRPISVLRLWSSEGFTQAIS